MVGDKLVLDGETPAELKTAKLFGDVAAVFTRFIKGKSRVVSRDDILGGEPVFAGTRVSIRHVGALVKKGVEPAQLTEDFPVLSRDDFAFAVQFLELGPAPGRPKKLKFRRGVRG